MSARLNLNTIPLFSWKGKTFTQISANLQKNNHPTTVVNRANLFRALPLKIYRKEIGASTETTDRVVCNSRASQSVQNFEIPGGTVTTDTIKYSNSNGLVNTLDIPYLSDNRTDHPCSSCDVSIQTPITNTSLYVRSLSQQDNARRRVRSAGMIKRKYDTTKNNDTYYTSTNQYLNSRNRTYSQNQYHNIRQGSGNAKPGSSYTTENKYASNTINHCSTTGSSTNYVPVYYKPNNSKFAEQGAVTSSNRLVRLKYDTITRAGLTFRSAFGASVENALAYGVPENGYTIKDKTGYPSNKTPTFSKYSDKMKVCAHTGFVS
jgi:hypothetical protein